MKSPEIINRLTRERIVELLTRAYGLKPPESLPEEWEKLVKGKG